MTSPLPRVSHATRRSQQVCATAIAHSTRLPCPRLMISSANTLVASLLRKRRPGMFISTTLYCSRYSPIPTGIRDLNSLFDSPASSASNDTFQKRWRFLLAEDCVDF
ncbi:hypothetical protein BDV93DRAFT_528164 [Ceratobasidium sp. AG-I]|nr:hypothetical protein BDV93DRAFT_528164 [Ceratobasidium sp. AG-I]